MKTQETQKVCVYIDGFNLYHGVRAMPEKEARWLNIEALCKRILKPWQELDQIHYFTSRISGSAEKQKRQSTYLEALETLPMVKLHFGQFQSSPVQCRNCLTTFYTSQEKMTDVNIAVKIICDAFHGSFDTAILISGDSDLSRPILAVRELFPDKRVVVVSPPNRVGVTLVSLAHGHYKLRPKTVLASQFSDIVYKEDGTPLKRPDSWK